jgi:hypothetical protein
MNQVLWRRKRQCHRIIRDGTGVSTSAIPEILRRFLALLEEERQIELRDGKWYSTDPAIGETHMLHPKSLVVGKTYVVQITGVARDVVAECIGHDEQRQLPMLKVLNAGAFHGTILKREDYIPIEEYDPEKHGPIEAAK